MNGSAKNKNQTLTMLTAQISLLVMVTMGVLNGGSIYDIGTYYIIAFAVLSFIQLIFSNIILVYVQDNQSNYLVPKNL